MKKGSETIVVRPFLETDFGEDVFGEPYEIRRCFILPKYSREDETVVTGYTVWFNRPADVRKIQARDEVTARGEVFQVDGVPGDWVKQRYEATELHLTMAAR